jgi:hypothetical protein
MRLAGLVSFALIAILAGVSAVLGWADFAAKGTRSDLERARREPARALEGGWTSWGARLSAALSMDARNPNLSESLAHWHERSARRGGAGAPALVEALRHFRAAAARRPTSSYTWSNIALVKVGLKELDSELAAAVVNAARFGPWEPEVQLAMADVLFTSGPQLTPAAREAARSLMINGLLRQDQQIYERAVLRGQLALLCSVPEAGRASFAMRCI